MRGTAVTLRSIAVPAYGPPLLYGIGQGAVAPAIALSARDLGASLGVAGLVVAVLGVGQIVGDVPAGALAARVGERRAMLLAVAVAVAALAGCLLAPSVAVLGASVFVLGLANSVFGLARQTYLSEVVPLHLRARALSTLGGTLRIGMFAGPFLAAPFIRAGGTDAAYALHLVVAVLAAVVLLVVPDLTRPVDGRSGRPPRARPAGVVAVVRRHRRVLVHLGTAVLLVGAVRASRQAVIPLWADHLGLDAATTSVVYGISGLLDTLLFYPSGKVMDLRGRAFVAVPSMAVLGLAHLLLPLTAGLPSLVAVAVLMGIGNGMGAGVVMVVGADVAPPGSRAEFLGVWRLFHDAGSAAGPLVVSAVTALVALGPAVAVMGLVGVGAAGLLARRLPGVAPGGAAPAGPAGPDAGQ
ncbi:MFS transporter [Kineosporia sp. A_224]|uniref:MFS transporter n=1 Tax=Kineosporia sp. A_224 TaxID=1962180 RepID=UPI001E5898C6|nr:MFS transporter [Kineosporia sp. A_224]